MLARRLIVGGTATFDVPQPDGTLTVGAISTVTNDTKYNAWPQVVRAAVLLLAHNKSNNHNADNSGNIVGRTSADSGATWGAEFTIADETLGAINASLVALASGRIVCAYNLFDAPDTPTDSVRVRYSDDGGATWSAKYTVNTGYTDTVTNGAGRMVQLEDGTVLLAVYGLNTGDTFYSASVLFSTDDGETFGGEVTIADGEALSQQQYEPSLVVLDNGDVLCLIRTTAGPPGMMYQSRSTTGGTTWGPTAAAFEGHSPANPIQLRSLTVLATVRNDDGDTEAFTSINRGASWQSQGVLSTGYDEMQYACSAQLESPDDRIAVIESVQPTVAITNADIRLIYVTENRS